MGDPMRLGGGQKADVVAAPEMAHRVIDQPHARHDAPRAILRWHEAVEPTSRREGELTVAQTLQCRAKVSSRHPGQLADLLRARREAPAGQQVIRDIADSQPSGHSYAECSFAGRSGSSCMRKPMSNVILHM